MRVKRKCHTRLFEYAKLATEFVFKVFANISIHPVRINGQRGGTEGGEKRYNSWESCSRPGLWCGAQRGSRCVAEAAVASGLNKGRCNRRTLGSLVLHLLQDGHDHVKLGSFGWVFVHAQPHHLADMRRDSWWNCRPKTFQSHLSNRTDFEIPC